MFKQVPITLITGYLGSGKTTLLNNILKNDKGYKIAVIVNDIGEVNIDAELIAKGGIVSSKDDSLVALQNGCICCTLNEDLIKQICELIGKGCFDHIVIEASGICEPLPIVQSIVAIGDMCAQNGVPKICDLDAVVCVVDAIRLAQEFGCGEDIVRENKDDEDIENLIFQQLEFCDVIVLNKVSDVSKEDLNKVKAVISKIQPVAKIFETDFANIDIDNIVDTKLFDIDKSAGSAGWIQEMEKDVEESCEEEHHHEHHHHEDEEHECHCHEEGHECHCHDHDEDEHECDCEKEGHECHCHHHHHHHGEGEVEEYGIGTYVYYRRTPFDRKKWFEFTSENWGRKIIRTKGLLYFADDMDTSYLFEQAGTQKNITDNGLWYASLPKEHLEQLFKEAPELKKGWDEEFGDRLVKLVFIGQHLDKEELKNTLDKI
ncbi:MAG: GTP-binding protein [Clostridia bacterium]|nr:GTP-binding protein [Clostridia bacterium]